MITPAISVLGAVEGLEVADAGLRAVRRADRARHPDRRCLRPAPRHRQRRRAVRPGHAALVRRARGCSGCAQIVAARPRCSRRVNPRHAVRVLRSSTGCTRFVVLGAVFLVRHRRRGALRRHGPLRPRGRSASPGSLVLPALLLNYFGQGALLLASPSAADATRSSCWRRPGRCYPLVVLATAATVIASQAMISGAFSMTQQAVQLGLLPRVEDPAHLRATQLGQIYVPAVNWLHAGRVPGLSCSASSSSSDLAARLRHRRHRHHGDHDAARRGRRPRGTGSGRCGASARVRRCSASSISRSSPRNATKIPNGGWVPLRCRRVMFALFVTWRDGRARSARGTAARARYRSRTLPGAAQRAATRVPGTAVFLVSQPGFVPTALLRNLEHNRVLPRAHRDPAPGDPAHRRARTGARAAIRWELYPSVHAGACALRLHGNAGRRDRACAARAARDCRIDEDCHVLPRLAPRARPRRAAGSPASRCGCLPTCSAAARRRRSSSACRPSASWCSRPKSRSSLDGLS